MSYSSPFSQTPQFGFGSGGAVPLIPTMTPEIAQALQGKDIKQAVDYVLYDTKYYKAGTAVNANDVIFFSTPVNGTDSLGNDTTVTFAKSPMDTNLVQAGQLQRGETLIITSVQMRVTVVCNLDLSLQTTGNTTLPNATGTNATLDASHSGILGSNLYSAVATAGVIKTKIGNNYYESRPIIQFPAEFGAAGFNSSLELGTVTAGSNISANDGIVNNGFGLPRQLCIPRTLVAGQNVGVYMNFYNPFNPGRSFSVQAILRGLLLRDAS